MALAPVLFYGRLLSPFLFFLFAFFLSLLPPPPPAEPALKRPKQAFHGYGFLPGYRQPLSNSIPLYKQKEAMRRMSPNDRRHWYIDPVPQYYGWDGEWRYFGRPGFGGGRHNGRRFWAGWAPAAVRGGLECR